MQKSSVIGTQKYKIM